MYIIIYTVYIYIYINIISYLKSWICNAKCSDKGAAAPQKHPIPRFWCTLRARSMLRSVSERLSSRTCYGFCWGYLGASCRVSYECILSIPAWILANGY